MKKNKLTYEIVSNAFDFYNKNLGEVFSENEAKNLSEKLLDTIKHDFLNMDERLPYILPLNTLGLIYFIGEYKKAYNYSKRTYKLKNNLESLGKGNAKKRKEFEKGLIDIYDEELDESIRYEQFFKNLLLLLLKKPSYKKVSLLLLGLFYTQYPMIKSLISEIFKDNKEAIKAVESIEYALEFFEYTHLSDGKILNSALIMIYTLLTQNLNMDGDKAYKNAKDLVDIFIDSNNDLPVDSYRQSHITERDIYYAGIYNGMPIFQWYINEQEKYFKEKDRQKLKVIMKLFLKGLSNDDNLSVKVNIENTTTEKMMSKIVEGLINDKQIDTLVNSVHTQFAKSPFPLLQHLPQ